jgi:hypothetical protein
MRTLYFVACVLLTIAIIMQCIAENEFGMAKKSRLRAIALSASDGSETRSEADRFIKLGRRFELTGGALAVLGVASWIISLRSRKGMTPVVPTALLAAYVLLAFGPPPV